jgi:hypothetical protein
MPWTSPNGRIFRIEESLDWTLVAEYTSVLYKPKVTMKRFMFVRAMLGRSGSRLGT